LDLRGGEVVGGCIRLHNEELHNFYTALNTIRVIKSMRMRWAGNYSRHGRDEKYKILVEKPEEITQKT
jgi:hypothetical protein